MVNRPNGVPGRQVLQTIEATRRSLGNRVHEADREIDQLTREARQYVQQRAETLETLAEHYLPELTDRSIRGTFHDVQSELDSVLAKQREEHRRLQREWDQALDLRQESEAELDRVTAELDRLVDERDGLEAKLAEKLAASETFRQLSEQTLAVELEVAKNQERVEESQQEASEKLPAYENSRLFKYLVDREYGTSKYKKSGLTRYLDSWVAGLVNYRQAKPSYDFLRITPQMMAAEVERRQDEFEALMQQVDAIEQEVSDQIGLSQVLEQGMAAGKERDVLLARIEQEEAERDRLESRLQQITDSDGEHYRQAIERFKRFLGTMDDAELAARTQQTRERTDDAIYAQVAEINERLDSAKLSAQRLRASQSEARRQFADTTDIVRRFRSSEYDSVRSYFVGLNLQASIDRYLRGEFHKEALWQELSRQQKFAPTWVEDQYGSGDLSEVLNSEFSYTLMRVLAEAAGAAMRHSQNSGSGGWRHGGGSRRRRSSGTRRPMKRPPSVRRRTGGGFTSGRGF